MVMVEIGNANAGSKSRTVSAYPSSYRLTLIWIIPAMTGVVTGHFEDKTTVAYCRSEAAIAPFLSRAISNPHYLREVR